MDTNTEITNENTTPAPTQDAPEQAVAEDPSIIGRLTPEEQQALFQVRQESQQLLAKVGEHELLKVRILARLDELNSQGETLLNNVTKRLGLEDGQKWVGMQDGTIRLINPPSQEGGAEATSQ